MGNKHSQSRYTHKTMPEMRMPNIQKQMPYMRQFLVGAYL